MASVKCGDAIDPSPCFADLMARSREGVCENTAKTRVVVDDEDVGHYRTP